VLDLAVPTVRPQTWPELRDLAVRISGPNRSFAPGTCYSEGRYAAIGGAFPNIDEIDLLFVDSITCASRICYRWCEQQVGPKDTRAAYGLLARELLTWLNVLQYARGKNVVLACVLEFVKDEFNRGEWRLQIEGSKTARELPAILDQVVSYQFLDFGDGKPPERGFCCVSPNPWAYPAKDRSGRLNLVEAPDLGQLLSKLTPIPLKEEK